MFVKFWNVDTSNCSFSKEYNALYKSDFRVTSYLFPFIFVQVRLHCIYIMWASMLK